MADRQQELADIGEFAPGVIEDLSKLAKEHNQKKTDSGPARLGFLDMLRGLCVLFTIIFHGCYMLAHYFNLGSGFGAKWYGILEKPYETIVMSLFVLLSGFFAQLSSNPKLRAWLLVSMALMVSVITLLVLPSVGIDNMGVEFGIIHLLACAKLLFAYRKKWFDKIPAFLGALVCLFLFFYTAPVEQKFFGIFGGLRIHLPPAWYQSDILLVLGIHTGGYTSWDYYPLLPWLFLFLFGCFAGKNIKSDTFPKFCYKKAMPPLGFLSRHALAAYLLHIPALYGLFYLLEMFINHT